MQSCFTFLEETINQFFSPPPDFFLYNPINEEGEERMERARHEIQLPPPPERQPQNQLHPEIRRIREISQERREESNSESEMENREQEEQEVENADGLKKEEVNQFPIAEWAKNKDEKENCVICVYEFKKKEKVRTLYCWHRFHVKCIDKWLKDHMTCPLCKEDMREMLRKGSGLKRNTMR